MAARLGAELLLRPAATKAAVTALTGPVIVHIATHGFFTDFSRINEIVMHGDEVDFDDPYADQEFLKVAQAVGVDSLGSARAVTINDPFANGAPTEPAELLLTGGLALAGANDAWQQRQTPRIRTPENLDYGELLAVDMVRLDLMGTSMVVLSACDTGLGNAVAGEGVWGLQLALQLAGAESLVMSLWRVDGETTTQLMRDFYDQVLTGESKSAALRAASLRLRQRYSHPRFWAPFLCLGGNGPLPSGLT